MHSSKLSSPIDLTGLKSDSEIIDYLYSKYKNIIMDKNNRPSLLGKFIFVDCSNWIDYKSEMFWHIISLSENESFNILPCNNDISLIKCNNNCLSKNNKITMSNGDVRNICFYRGIRLNWFTDIINLANSADRNIKKWIKDNKLHIRFIHDTTDYIIIFDIKKSRYYFKTAFPVFYINSKDNYDKDYAQFRV